MKQNFILRNDGIRERIKLALDLLPFEPPHEIIFRPYKAKRSLEQNALYWDWLTVFGNEIGQSKNEMHEMMRLELLMPIFRRDDEEYNELMEKFHQSAKAMGDTNPYTNHMLKDAILHNTSTTDASVSQMSEYLNEIEGKARNLDIYLPHPEDRGRI